VKKNFSFYTLAEREQKAVKSGQCVCLCGCAWANCGGSSSMELDLDSREYTPQNSN
jgi:hypothetical protein